MLEDQIAGRNDSWAIRWRASSFLNDKLTLYPKISLVYNTGTDGSGTNSGDSFIYDSSVACRPIDVSVLDIEEDMVMREEVKKFYMRLCSPFRRMQQLFLSKLRLV